MRFTPAMSDIQLRLNEALNFSVDPAIFRKYRDTHFRWYTSPTEICLLRRLMLFPFSMRPIVRAFVDTIYFTVKNPEPLNHEPDRDDEGELAHVYDVIHSALTLDDEDLFLFTTFNLLVIYPAFREALARQSNIHTMRCLIAFLQYGVTTLNTACLEKTNAVAAIHGFVEAARDIVLNGMTTCALYLTFIHNHYAAAEERVQHSNPKRFSPSCDLPPEYGLFSIHSMQCPFYRSPWEPHDDSGFAKLRAGLRLPPTTVLEQGNMGASTPGPQAMYETIEQFYPEDVFLHPDESVKRMTIWSFVMFHTTLVRNNFRPPDKRMHTRATRAMQRFMQQRAVTEDRQRREGIDADDDDSGDE